MALVWVALAGICFVVFLALAADTARVYLAAHQLQNAADASALAGVYRVRHDAFGGEPPAHRAAVTTALSNSAGGGAAAGGGAVLLAANLGNNASGDVVIGTYNAGNDSFTPGVTQPNAVKVTARRTAGSPGGALPLLFASLAGVNSSNVSRTAIATIGGPSIGAGLILLNRRDPGSAALTGTGNQIKINIPNGSVQINSQSDDAVSWTGHPTINAQAVFVGGNQQSLVGAGIVTGVVSINAPPVEDPLGSLPPPAKPGAPVGNTPSVLNPGYYNNFPTNRSVTLNPGIYWIDGGIDMTGNRTIDATAGCLLFFNTGGIELGGNSGLTINPPTSGPYAGISIYQARGNASPSTLQGTPGSSSSGLFYFPSAKLTVAGNPTALASQVIADTLHVQGNGQLNVNYNGNFQIQGHKIWLVK
jgi:Flp pilus assembly protein TadG